MSKQRLRKLILLLADFVIFLGISVLVMAFSLMGEPASAYWGVLPSFLALYGCMLLFQILFRTYDSLWRYAAHVEYFTLLLGAACGTILYEILHYRLHLLKLASIYVWGVASLGVLGMLGFRLGYRMFREYRGVWRSKGDSRLPVAIVGAGAAGTMLMRELQHNAQNGFRPVCFFDDEPTKLKRRIGGIPVRGTLEEIPALLYGTDIKHIFVAIPSMSEGRTREILQICHQVTGAQVRILPSAFLERPEVERKTIQTELRKVEIADLLGRKQVDLNNVAVQAFVTHKVVLVTGGGGSIGSELSRQIAAAQPKRLVLVDIYENSLYAIQQELMRTYGDRLDLQVEIASVRDGTRMDTLFAELRPQVVFHAAAHKHVPLMERNPQEAVRNNVFGTYHVVMAAHKSGVEKFVQISTDKAVNPTNVMGATKRMCEMILQGVQERSVTEFAAVRFGNVLGSNGSVVPLFQKQIEMGGPVTITDKRITRYFMTIPEAVQLVLQAGAMAKKHQVFVLDMGKPTRILDLAEHMIRLSGYEPYEDIPIQEIGLRPGEKLYEELLLGDRVQKTENKLIFVDEQPDLTYEALQDKLSLLRAALETRDDGQVVEALHQVVPTFLPPELVNATVAEDKAVNASEKRMVSHL